MKTTLTIQESAELIKRGVSKDKASAAVIYLDYAGEEVEPHKVFKREGDGVLLTRLRNGTVIKVEAKIVLKDSGSNYSVPIFTLADLLSLFPKHIPFANAEWYLNIQWDILDNKCHVQYLDFDHDDEVVKEEEAPELIDALYLLTLAVINHVKLD